MILILSNPTDDAHLNAVAAELLRRGEEFRIYDPAAYPGTSSLSLAGTAKGVQAVLRKDGRDLDLAHVTSVWYRRPGELVLSDRLLPEEAQ